MGQTEYKFRTVERSNQELPDEEVQEDVEEQAVMIRVRLVLMIQQQGRKEATNDEVSIIFSDRLPRFRRTSLLTLPQIIHPPLVILLHLSKGGIRRSRRGLKGAG